MWNAISLIKDLNSCRRVHNHYTTGTRYIFIKKCVRSFIEVRKYVWLCFRLYLYMYVAIQHKYGWANSAGLFDLYIYYLPTCLLLFYYSFFDNHFSVCLSVCLCLSPCCLIKWFSFFFPHKVCSSIHSSPLFFVISKLSYSLSLFLSLSSLSLSLSFSLSLFLSLSLSIYLSIFMFLSCPDSIPLFHPLSLSFSLFLSPHCSFNQMILFFFLYKVSSQIYPLLLSCHI